MQRKTECEAVASSGWNLGTVGRELSVHGALAWPGLQRDLGTGLKAR